METKNFTAMLYEMETFNSGIKDLANYQEDAIIVAGRRNENNFWLSRLSALGIM